MARKVNNRQLKTEKPVVIGAGITEQWYFKHLNNLRIVSVKICPRLFGKENASSLDRRIESVLKDGNKAVVVFDADVTAWNETERKNIEKLHVKYSKEAGVELYDSMPSIEYWFLLHYVETNRYYGTSKNVITELCKYINGFNKSETFLKNEKWVQDMLADEGMQKAISRAERFGKAGNSWTELWKFFKKI